MNVDIFTFCESVHNYNEKLVIVGTFNAIDSPKFPFRPSELSLVLNISLDKEDGETLEGDLKIYKRDNKEIVLLDVPISLNATFPDKAVKAYVNFMGSLVGIIIPEPGNYVASVTIGDYSREIDLYVTESDNG